MSLAILPFNYSAVGWDAAYCDDHVCLSARASISHEPLAHTSPNFLRLLPVANGYGSVLIRRRFNTLCPSGFADDVICSHPMAQTTQIKRKLNVNQRTKGKV